MLTKEWVLKRLVEIDAAASEAQQHTAARGAVELIGKELGMFIDRKESGKPGDFASLQAPAEILDAVRRELGDEAADAIAKVLARTAARADFDDSTPEKYDTTQ